MSGRIASLLAALIGATTIAFADDVDWKFYGRTVLNERTGKIELSCFFDANSIDFPTGGHLRVWTKCMDEKDMHNFDYHSDLGKKIIKAAAQKILDYYLPPYAVIDDVSIDTVQSIVGDEQLADLSYIQPVSRIFYEFNCPEKMGSRIKHFYAQW